LITVFFIIFATHVKHRYLMIGKQEFDKAFREYYSPLFFFARQYIVSDDECYDIVSSVFEDIWRDADNIQPETLRTLLYIKVRNCCINAIRHKDTQSRYAEYVKAMTDIYIANNEFEEQQERESIIKAVIAKLKPPADLIFKLRLRDGKKYQEIADETNISLGMVKKYMRKALAMISEMNKNKPAR